MKSQGQRLGKSERREASHAHGAAGEAASESARSRGPSILNDGDAVDLDQVVLARQALTTTVLVGASPAGYLADRVVGRRNAMSVR